MDVDGVALDGVVGEEAHAFARGVELCEFAVSVGERRHVLKSKLRLLRHQPAVHDEPLRVAVLRVEGVRVEAHLGAHVHQLPDVRKLVVVLIHERASERKVLRLEQRRAAAQRTDLLVHDAHQRLVLAQELIHHAGALHELHHATPEIRANNLILVLLFNKVRLNKLSLCGWRIFL